MPPGGAKSTGSMSERLLEAQEESITAKKHSTGAPGELKARLTLALQHQQKRKKNKSKKYMFRKLHSRLVEHVSIHGGLLGVSI